MAELERVQDVVNQAAVQAATTIMMALRAMDVKFHLAPTANMRE